MKTRCKKNVVMQDSIKEEFTQGRDYEVGVLVSSESLVVGAINNSGKFHRIVTARVHPADLKFFQDHFDGGANQ